MSFMGWIIDRLNWVSDVFYELYLDCYYAGWPLEVLDTWLYSLSSTFASLAWDFYDFSSWVSDVAAKVAKILNWSTIWSYILIYIPNLEQIRDWFYYWWTWVDGRITSWWSSTSSDVLGWIAEAKDWAKLWIDYLQSQVNSLSVKIDEVIALIPDVSELIAWFSNWPGHIISEVDNWWTGALLEVQGLINSAFILRENFWQGWQDWRDKVTEFFTDPWEFLWARFADWFLGPEG
uniref:Uncharacterized protein n=1 Tax=viral metagenome TaxID=1070528 RepID=A0A6M3XY95_9ZZZZ